MGLIGAIGGIAQSIIDSRTQKRNVDMTNQANMNLAQYQYNKDLEMWNRANEYNSPSAQMARFQQAGLNPNLIYGGSVSGAAGNTATSLPKFQAPQISYDYKSPVNLLMSLNSFQDFSLKQAQIKNTQEQYWNIHSQSIFNRAKAIMADQEMKKLFFQESIDKNGMGTWRIKPEMEGIFNEILTGKWTKGPKEVEKYSADIARINAETEYKTAVTRYILQDKLARWASIIGGILK